MGHRPPITRPRESRAFVDEVLTDLRHARWMPGAWAVFLRRCCERSAEQARLRPRAVVQLTALHLAFLAANGNSRLRLAASWAMATTHLGLLGPGRRSIGVADALSLIRANLPAARWSPLVAIGTDLADGWLARRAGQTAFGAYADALADVAFWTRLVWRREPSRILRAAAAMAWLLPLAGIGAVYFAAGRTVDRPRPLLIGHLSIGLQCLLAARAARGT